MTREVTTANGFRFVVDDEDFDVASQGGWYGAVIDKRNGGVYIIRSARTRFADGHVRRSIEYLHRIIAGNPANAIIDHANGDTLDNRRSNLRLASRGQNAVNTGLRSTNRSGFKGVSFRRQGAWRAYIGIARRTIHLGYFATAEEAARAYDAAALDHFGEFAQLNFPSDK